MNKRKTPFFVIVSIGIIIGINVLLGIVLANNSKMSLKKLIDDRMLGITNAAAKLINGDDLMKLRAEDEGTEAYKKINDTLAAFQNNADLKYVYCIRDMGGKRFVFTVDPTIEDPGKFGDPVAYTDALYTASGGIAATDDEPYTDGWGRFYSAYSPVFDSSGQVAGIVAADFSAEWYDEQVSAQRRSIEIFILVSVLICFVLMRMLAKRTHALENALHAADTLNKQLSSISNIYVSMYDVNIDDDTFTEIKTTQVYQSTLLKNSEHGAGTMMKELAKNASSAASRNDLLRFVDISTLKERLRKTETLSMEFMDNNLGKWLRARFIVSQRDREGIPTNVLLMGEDIDKEKKAREELLDMSERAIAANEAKSSFLSIMSHDIRTPISVVLGMNEMILRECVDQNVIGYSKNIKTAGDMLLGLINNILDFSKIEAGKLELIYVEYDLSAMLNELVNMVHTQAENKGLALSLNFDKDTPKCLYGDELRIKQVITNILTNAVKYTMEGSITFTISFETVDGDPNSVILYVAIKDTGIGIKPEDMDKLFKEFVRIDEKRIRKVEGTGLGMTITQSLLGMMGSTLRVDSGYGIGSKFYFHLKQKVIKWEPLGDYEATYNNSQRIRHSYHEKFTAPKAQILVVDDNPMNLMVFRSLLKSTMMKIDTASNAEDGLQLAAQKKYDVLFLDHMMPNKDGIEMLHELRNQPEGLNIKTPAICITANAISGARKEYISAGFDDYITKPLDSDKLEDMLITYLPMEKLEAPVTEETDPNSPDTTTAIPSILAPLEGEDWIDLALGLKNSGSADALVSLLKVFYESLEEKVDEIEDYYRSHNIRDYIIRVHALKSSARIIGARELGEKAQQLENAGTRGDMDYIREHLDAFTAKCRSIKAPLSNVFSTVEVHDDKPEADSQFLKEACEQIRIAAEDMDCDRLEDIFADIERYKIPTKYESLWKQLKKALGQYDYDKLLSLLPKED